MWPDPSDFYQNVGRWRNKLEVTESQRCLEFPEHDQSPLGCAKCRSCLFAKRTGGNEDSFKIEFHF